MLPERDLQVAEWGENLFYNQLLKSENTSKVVDVRSTKAFQEIDVDFLQETTNGTVYLYEVKTDTKAHDTGCLIYEIISNVKYMTIGGHNKSKCDYFVFCVYGEEYHYYLAQSQKLKEYLTQSREKEKELGTKVYITGDNAISYIFNIRLAIQNGVLIERRING